MVKLTSLISALRTLCVALLEVMLLSFVMAHTSADSAIPVVDEQTITVRVLSKYHPQEVRIETRSRLFKFDQGNLKTFEFSAEPSDDIKVTVNNDVSRIYRGRIELNWLEGEYTILNITALEKYVAGVVVGELGANAPAELIKAQAILARTYATKVAKRNQLSDLAYHQVFTGFDHYASNVYSKTVQTQGQYLMRDNGLADALFHAQCGSAIYSAGQFWQSEQWFAPVNFPANLEKGEPWFVDLTMEQLRAVFSVAGPLQRLAGHPDKIRVGSERFAVERFRLKINRKYGWNTLPSSEFKIESNNNGYRFTGRGLGHLVGLCQQQAASLANEGWTAVQLLNTFYPQTYIDRY